jgi:hypothetical protein
LACRHSGVNNRGIQFTQPADFEGARVPEALGALVKADAEKMVAAHQRVRDHRGVRMRFLGLTIPIQRGPMALNVGSLRCRNLLESELDGTRRGHRESDAHSLDPRRAFTLLPY